MATIIKDLLENDYDLIIINYEIKGDFVLKALSGARKIVFTDGAINRFKHFYEQHQDTKSKRGPDFIIGDMDSIQSDSLDWLKDTFGEKSFKVIESKDQNRTDYEKALELLYSFYSDSDADCRGCGVVVLNCFGGRLDHTLAILHSSYLYPHLNIQLMNESCIARIILSKLSVIEFVGFQGKTCGILPLFGPIQIKTVGLQWELDKNLTLKFGSKISTSNKIISSQVEIYNYADKDTTTTPFIWTHEI